MRVMKDVTCRPRMAWLLGFAAILLAPSMQAAAAPHEANPVHDAQDARRNPSASGGSAALAGDWAYRTDCNLGHDAEISVQKTTPSVEGTWSDGTRNSGSQGRFKGDWRDGKLFVRFCTEDTPDGGYPACPAYGDVAGYLSPEGAHLVWYRTVGTPAEGKFNKYVVLGRKPKGGDVPKDAVCHDA
jgi:hypothetical protein